MTEQIERVEEAAERAATAPRERTGYDAALAQERWQAFWEDRPDLRCPTTTARASAATC